MTSAMTVENRYRVFGEREAREESPTYQRLALAVAADRALLDLLNELPERKRQPNLLFAAARYLGGPVADPAEFTTWVMASWDDLARVMLRRSTQTNEPARCAVLLPVLAQLPQPLALLEVGASAGLCLYPDRYRYRYGAHHVGPPDSEVRLDCAVEGPVPLPERVPSVVWRAGLDLNPLHVTDDDDMRWLEALVWPEQHDRRARLRAAAHLVRTEPLTLVRGDLVADLPSLAAQAPADATLVVFHSAVLSYVPAQTRRDFGELAMSLPARWLANEAMGVLDGPAKLLATQPGRAGEFLVTLDGRPVAFTAPHGQAVRWLESSDLRP